MEKKLVLTGLKNFFYACIAQSSTLLLNFLITLIVPMLVGVEEYSYWQLFFFYISYAGFFQFGINDGIYLRYGGIKYENLNKDKIKTQFIVLLGSQIIISIGLIVYSLVFSSNIMRQYVICASAISIVIIGMTTFLWYILQATNRIKEYSRAVMSDKLFSIISIILLLIFNIKNFKMLIILNVLGKLIGFIYCIYYCKDIFKGKFLGFKSTIIECKANISSGIKLMLSNVSSMFILGIGRVVIDNVWGIVTFGKVSLAISLTNFILLFINQISIVIFPTLKNMSKENLKKIYVFISNYANIFLLFVFLLYLPMYIFIGAILPQYSESMIYFALIIPLCTFTGKMQVLSNTYMKVIRKEGTLLLINFISVVLSGILCCLSAYILKNLYAIIISMTIVAVFRSIVCDLYLMKHFKYNVVKSIIINVLYSLIFLTTTFYLNPFISFAIYLIIYLIYLSHNKEKVLYLFNVIKRFLNKNKNKEKIINSSNI